MSHFTEYNTPTRETLNTLKRLWQNHPDLFGELFQSQKDYGEIYQRRKLDDAVHSINSLIDAGLILDYQDGCSVEAQCQINVIKRPELDSPLFICTDFPKHNEKRVFPYDDEAKEWLKLYNKSPIMGKIQTIVDLCCGAGSMGLWLAKFYPQAIVYGFDNNEEALNYARYNADLNNIKNFLVYKWDAEWLPEWDLTQIRDTPLHIVNQTKLQWQTLKGQVDLVCGDPPFTMNPLKGGYEHSHGGSDGSRISHKNIENAAYLLKPSGVFLMITYALGNKEKPTKILETIERYLTKDQYEIEQEPTPIPEALVWRVNGEKALKQPMDVQYMIVRYNDDAYHYLYKDEGLSPKMYQQWVQEKIDEGFTHLHYVWFKVRKK